MSLRQQPLAGGVWGVWAGGRLDAELAPDLDRVLASLLAEGHTRLVIDLSETEYIGSVGLKSILAAWRQARAIGGDVVVTGLQPRVREVFSIVGFDRVFNICESPEAAARTLSGVIDD